MTNNASKLLFPAEEQHLFIRGPVGALEAVAKPANSPTQAIAAIVCHPHPLYGGTMDNKVVTTVTRALRDLGISTVRFNFRGVGKSAGQYDNGEGETDDLFAVYDWLQETLPNHSIWLAGFSFGTYVAYRAAQQIKPAQLICVAPALERFDFAKLGLPDYPCIVIQGELDEVIPPAQVYQWAAGLPMTLTQLIRIPEASHFFHGKLIELREQLQQALLPALKQ